ncbi:MAG TPA: DUF2993 domain-containing protein [Coleofasciculaceae cyanobacterium]
MEFLTILLSSLLAIVSPVGLVTDSVVEGAIRSRLDKVEQLEVRIDNTPNYEIIRGNVERVRVAGRGLWLTSDVRVDTLELETDPISIDLQSLRQRDRKSPRDALKQPVQTGVHLIVTEADMNRVLRSPRAIAQFKQIGRRLVGDSAQAYEFLNPQIDFLGNNRLRFQVDVKQGNAQPQQVTVESGIGITNGHSLQLLEPTASINGVKLPPQVVVGFATGISNRFNLRKLEEAGITARILQLQVGTDTLDAAAFVRLDTSNRRPEPSTETN